MHLFCCVALFTSHMKGVLCCCCCVLRGNNQKHIARNGQKRRYLFVFLTKAVSIVEHTVENVLCAELRWGRGGKMCLLVISRLVLFSSAKENERQKKQSEINLRWFGSFAICILNLNLQSVFFLRLSKNIKPNIHFILYHLFRFLLILKIIVCIIS